MKKLLEMITEAVDISRFETSKFKRKSTGEGNIEDFKKTVSGNSHDFNREMKANYEKSSKI